MSIRLAENSRAAHSSVSWTAWAVRPAVPRPPSGDRLASEFSASLIDTLYGAYDPSYNHGLGGLHGGYARTRTSKTNLRVSLGFHSFSYVAGVTVSGSLGSGVGRLEVGGGRAAAGTIVAATPNNFSGTLGGVHIHFTITNAGTTALTASAGRWMRRQ